LSDMVRITVEDGTWRGGRRTGVERRRRRGGGEPCWSAGGDEDVEFRHGCGVVAGVVERRRRQERRNEGEKMRTVELRVQEGFWIGRGCRIRTFHVSGLPQTSPNFVFSLWEKSRPDRPVDRYSPSLDGYRDPDSAVWTDVGGLRVRLADALRLRTRPVVFAQIITRV
jgi:hypothetical protein